MNEGGALDWVVFRDSGYITTNNLYQFVYGTGSNSLYAFRCRDYFASWWVKQGHGASWACLLRGRQGDGCVHMGSSEWFGSVQMLACANRVGVDASCSSLSAACVPQLSNNALACLP